jgi:hypothetical protein
LQEVGQFYFKKPKQGLYIICPAQLPYRNRFKS